jgi:hypothetical protein
VDSIEGLEKPLLCLDPRAKGPKKRQIAGSSMKGVQMKRIARFSILRSKIGMVVDGIDGLEKPSPYRNPRDEGPRKRRLAWPTVRTVQNPENRRS